MFRKCKQGIHSIQPGADGKPEIDPDEAETVRLIYNRFLAGDSYTVIARMLEGR